MIDTTLSSRASPETLPVLRLDIPGGLADALLEALEAEALSAVVWQEDAAPRAQISLYLEHADEVEAALPGLRRALASVGLSSLQPLREALRREDWAESWKRFFHARRVSARIVVCPPWERWTPRTGDLVVTIDPGMSFGTGQHDTTRDCLVFLDQLAAAGVRGAMRDLGCGSGILSLAAARLGFAPVHGLDHDPVAVETARAQARLNPLAADVRFDAGDLATAAGAAAPATVVAANILAPVLIEQAGAVAACVAPGGWLLLAGILRAQYAAVREAYRALDFRETESRAGREWQSGCFTSNSHYAAIRFPTAAGS